MSRRFSEEFHAFLRGYIPGHTQQEVSEAVFERFGIDMTPVQVKSYKSNHHINSGTKPGLIAGSPTKLYPKKIADYIKENHKGSSPMEMTWRLNTIFGTHYNIGQIRAYYKNHKLQSGIDARFQPGHVPPNKGMKGMKMHPNAVATQFKPGHTPTNKCRIGTVLVKTDGYLWRKVGEGARDWRQEHILRWEKANGPIPEGMKIVFLDGDRRNVSLDNLALVSNEVNLEMNRHGLRCRDPEITQTAILVAKINTVLYKKRKDRQNDHSN